MPPKKRVTFNPNVNIRHIPSENRGRRVPPRGRPIPPPPPPPPPTPPPLPRRNRTRSLRDVAASLQCIAPTPPPSLRPPRSRSLRRYSGMKNLTKIPKLKRGAFTREIAKKLFFLKANWIFKTISYKNLQKERRIKIIQTKS